MTTVRRQGSCVPRASRQSLGVPFPFLQISVRWYIVH